MSESEKYLREILNDQKLSEDSKELADLRAERDNVESLLRDEFGDAPSIRYGGSKAKNTLIRESYDLDIISYFARDDDSAGETLEEIYNNTRDALQKKYMVLSKGQALRLFGQNKVDFHIDVVPGRFIDGDDGDVYLHRTTGDKKRLKTNLDVHIAHVRDSGVVETIKLMKLWRTRYHVGVRTFALELATIKALFGWRNESLDEQLMQVFSQFADNIDNIAIEDPANPNGNDLSELWNDGVRQNVSAAAKSAIATIKSSGWKGIFGEPKSSSEKRIEVLERAASTAPAQTKPWSKNGV